MSINSMTFTAHATRDAELAHTKNNTPVVSVGIAINFGYGEQKGTAFSKLRIYGKPCEWLQEIRKGDLVIASNVEYCIETYTKGDEEKKVHFFNAGINSRVMRIGKTTEQGDSSVDEKQSSDCDSDNMPF